MNEVTNKYKNDLTRLLKDVNYDEIPEINPVIARLVENLNVSIYAKLAVISIDASMRFLNRIGDPGVSNKDILIGDIVSAYFYKCTMMNNDLKFLDIMTKAISKQNELKIDLKNSTNAENIELIKDIESIFIITLIDYYKINLDKSMIKDDIYAYLIKA